MIEIDTVGLARMIDRGKPGSIYLAARYSRREELCSYRAELEAAGYTVTSRWLNGAHQFYQGTPIGDEQERAVEDLAPEALALCRHFAQEDYADVLAAETLVAFTEIPRASTSRGGRHVELGIALGLGKRVLVVGPRENVFCALPQVDWHPDWAAARAALVEMEAASARP